MTIFGEAGTLVAIIMFLPLKKPSLSLMACFLDVKGFKKHFLFIHMYKKVDSFRRIPTSEARTDFMNFSHFKEHSLKVFKCL